MKYIKLFENFNIDIEKELKKFDIENYIINNDGSVDVDGDVILHKLTLTKIPIKFGKVTGKFNCTENSLKSLENCPYYVGGEFDCAYNNLSNLNGSPSEVIGSFYCDHNKLTSLEGMPLEVGKDFYCYQNKIKTLNSVSNIEGYIYCDDIDISKFDGYCKGFKIYNNSKWTNVALNESNDVKSNHIKYRLRGYDIKNYTINEDGTIDVDGDVPLFGQNLEKIPFNFGKVTGHFDISYNRLTSLEGSPYYVGGNFNCSLNKLKDLKGSPNEVSGSFYASSNELESLNGMPLEIGKDFYCSANFNLNKLDSISNIERNIYCDNTKVDLNNNRFEGYCKEIIKK